LYPTKEKTKLLTPEGIVIAKLPFSDVRVLVLEFFACTVTPANGVSDGDAETTPVILFV
jgi:hypothetical protein